MKFNTSAHRIQSIRVIAQTYKDKARGLLTYSQTVQLSSQRIILHVAVDDLENLIIFLRDIVQAYMQTKEDMQRVVYLRPPAFLGFNPLILLHVEREFYGHPEAGLLWFKTYHKRHSDHLKLTPA